MVKKEQLINRIQEKVVGCRIILMDRSIPNTFLNIEPIN